ncbi:hypothetical protein [Zhongshania aliphaticivorans]|nr:hypothetical protein [Zhongshania aliphaticivorans]
MSYTAPFNKNIDASLEVGDSLSKATLELLEEDNVPFRVQIQLETSMSIQNEGPHLDLIDWRHCTTEWALIESTDDNTFQLPDFNDVNVDCFPAVTDEEIASEVMRVGGQEWVDIANGKGWPAGYRPISIELSRVRLKIEKFIEGEWSRVTVMNIAIPMGC